MRPWARHWFSLPMPNRRYPMASLSATRTPTMPPRSSTGEERERESSRGSHETMDVERKLMLYTDPLDLFSLFCFLLRLGRTPPREPQSLSVPWAESASGHTNLDPSPAFYHQQIHHDNEQRLLSRRMTDRRRPRRRPAEEERTTVPGRTPRAAGDRRRRHAKWTRAHARRTTHGGGENDQKLPIQASAWSACPRARLGRLTSLARRRRRPHAARA